MSKVLRPAPAAASITMPGDGTTVEFAALFVRLVRARLLGRDRLRRS
ncbi:MAG: hypothetical protein WD766_02505 [Gemmatimonadota bacterium]